MTEEEKIQRYLGERKVVRTFLKEHDLTETQLETLAYLGINNLDMSSRGIILGDLASKLDHYNLTSISSASSGLFKKGLIHKAPNPGEGHGNAVLARLTEKGREVYNSLLEKL